MCIGVRRAHVRVAVVVHLIEMIFLLHAILVVLIPIYIVMQAQCNVQAR